MGIQECEGFQGMLGLYETTTIPRSFVVQCSGRCGGVAFLRLTVWADCVGGWGEVFLSLGFMRWLWGASVHAATNDVGSSGSTLQNSARHARGFLEWLEPSQGRLRIRAPRE